MLEPLALTPHLQMNSSFRQKGAHANGKLIRGFMNDASVKTSISSIPGKFETVIFAKSPKKAFNTTSTRFNGFELIENPGPGTYSSLNTTARSYSVLGYGNGFLSKTARQTFNAKYLNNGPGPGSYESATNSRILNSSKNSSLKPTEDSIESWQRKENSKKIKARLIPGPGSYNPRNSSIGKENKTYYSSFVSKCNREEYLNISKYPGPGVYEIKRTLLESKPFKALGPYSSFAESTQPKIDKTRILIDKLEGKNEEAQVPGPGFYEKTSKKSTENEEKVNSVFQLGFRDRFGDPIFTNEEAKEKFDKKQRKLGPGYYPMQMGVGRSETEKNEVSGSVFMSETGRRPFGDVGKRMGPNGNVPYKMPKKKSYLLNLARKWVG